MIVLGNKYLKFNYTKAQLMLGFLLLCISCSDYKKAYSISGEAMGTTYSIKLVTSKDNINKQSLKNDIDSLFVKLNKQMSTWDPNSEISLFNSWKSLAPYDVSDELLYVIDNSIEISKQTDGLFDVTIYDLMSLWGFGPNPKLSFPDNQKIKQAMQNSGYKYIKTENGKLVKNNKSIKLDLNAIAKGYGVDKIFNFLFKKGIENIFVEVGGEVRAIGRNKNNKKWSIGIEDPIENDVIQSNLSAIIYLSNKSVATSGNYRNIVNLDGEILGHTINPKTGLPIQTDVLSVTVLSELCMHSDAWATALMVMDYKTGYSKVENNPDIDAIWILEDSISKEPYFSISGDIEVSEMIYPIK